MRVKAQCDHCGREFLFFQLYNASSFDADRCPHCGRHLGVVGVRRLALEVDRTAAALVRTLRELAVRDPSFRLDADSILEPIAAVVGELAVPTTRDAGVHERHDDRRTNAAA
jgi:hypothetical protein